MSKDLIIFKEDEIRKNLKVQSTKIDRIDKTLNTITSLSNIGELITETLHICDSILKSFISFKEIELKIYDNGKRREMVINLFNESNSNVQKLIYNLLEIYKNPKDEKSNDNNFKLLMKAMSQSENLTLEILNKI